MILSEKIKNCEKGMYLLLDYIQMWMEPCV